MSEITYEWASWQVLVGKNDGADADTDPERVPAQGTVRFVASVPYLTVPVGEPNPVTLLPEDRVAVFDGAGYLSTPDAEDPTLPAYPGLRLEATNDPDLSTQGWVWTAYPTITNSSKKIAPFSFALLGGAPVNLATVVKVPASPGLGTAQAEALVGAAQSSAATAETAATGAEAAAELAAAAAQVTDENIADLIATPGTGTAGAVTVLVEAAAADKLGVDEAMDTYQSRAGLDAAAAAKIGVDGSALRGAVQTVAADAAGKLDTDQLDTEAEALVNNPGSSWWLKLLVWLKTLFLGKREIVVSVTEFGAKGDWVSGTGTGTDNLAAFNAAYAYAASIVGYAVKLYIPPGLYRFSAEWNIWRANSPRNDLVVEGADELSSVLVSDFYGAGKTLVKVSAPAGSATRASPTTIRNLGFASVSRTGGQNPVYLDINGWGESRATALRFGPTNNTAFRVGSAQNVRIGTITSFYAGHHFNYKATDALTFTTTTGGAITASASIFTAADVGKIITILPATEDLRIQYVIQSVTSGTEATLTGMQLLATTGAKGYFEAAAGAITAGQTQFVADAPCFTADDVGRVIIVRGARSGSWGAGNLRAVIQAYTNPTTVTLDTPAGVTVTRAPFTTPAVEFYSTPGADVLSSDTNDFKVDLLHIENYRGVGLVAAPSIFVDLDKFKIHGEHDPVDASHSIAAMWLDDFSGTMSGVLDGVATGDARMHFSNMNDTLTIDSIKSRRLRGETLFKAAPMTDPKGVVHIDAFTAYKTTISGDPNDLISDPNASPRVFFNGVVNMLGDTRAPRIYAGKGSYFLPDGSFVNGPTTSPGLFASILSGMNGARLLFEDYATKKFSLGNIAGGGTAFTITDETAALVRLLINNTGSVLPGADNTQPLGSSTSRWSDVVTKRLTIGSTNIIHDAGTGSPEGVLAAGYGSTWIRTDGTAGTLKYEKRSGTGNTGWVAVW